MASHSSQTTITRLGIFSPALFDRYFFLAFLIGCAVEVFSFLSFLFPFLQVYFFLGYCALLIAIGFRRLDIAVFFVFADLVIDSKGYLFALPIAHLVFPFRLGLFLALILVWIIFFFKKRSTVFWTSRFRLPFFIVALAIGWGIISALIHGNPRSFLFFDVNGYLFLALLFPVFDAIRTPLDVRRFVAVLLAFLSVSLLKTFFFLFVFSQELVPFTTPLYTWVRTSGVGEITKLDLLYRVFFQSHIYHVFFFFLFFFALVFSPRPQFFRSQQTRGLWWRGLASLMVVFISYSRSFWLAACLVLFVSGIFFFWFWKFSWKKVFFIYASLAVSFLIGYVVVFLAVSLPLAHRIPPNLAATTLISERSGDVRTEPAGSSRRELFFALIHKISEAPLLGSGFGTPVTYKTSDPRALGNNPNGLYTTYAFEWGYLDIWVKMGMLGIGAFVWLFWSLLAGAVPFFRKSDSTMAPFVIGVIAGLFALFLIHGTTPYLNHPLGIGWVVFAAVVLEVFSHPEQKDIS